MQIDCIKFKLDQIVLIIEALVNNYIMCACD